MSNGELMVSLRSRLDGVEQDLAKTEAGIDDVEKATVKLDKASTSYLRTLQQTMNTEMQKERAERKALETQKAKEEALRREAKLRQEMEAYYGKAPVEMKHEANAAIGKARAMQILGQSSRGAGMGMGALTAGAAKFLPVIGAVAAAVMVAVRVFREYQQAVRQAEQAAAGLAGEATAGVVDTAGALQAAGVSDVSAVVDAIRSSEGTASEEQLQGFVRSLAEDRLSRGQRLRTGEAVALVRQRAAFGAVVTDQELQAASLISRDRAADVAVEYRARTGRRLTVDAAQELAAIQSGIVSRDPAQQALRDLRRSVAGAGSVGAAGRALDQLGDRAGMALADQAAQREVEQARIALGETAEAARGRELERVGRVREAASAIGTLRPGSAGVGQVIFDQLGQPLIQAGEDLGVGPQRRIQVEVMNAKQIGTAVQRRAGRRD